MDISEKNIRQTASEIDLDNNGNKKPVRKVKPMTRAISLTLSTDQLHKNGEPVLTEGIYKGKNL